MERVRGLGGLVEGYAGRRRVVGAVGVPTPPRGGGRVVAEIGEERLDEGEKKERRKK